MEPLSAAEKLRALDLLMSNPYFAKDPQVATEIAQMLGLDPEELAKVRDEHRTSSRGRVRRSGLSTSARVNDSGQDAKRKVPGTGFRGARGTVVYLDEFRSMEAKRSLPESGKDTGEE